MLELEVVGELAMWVTRLRLRRRASGVWTQQPLAWSAAVRNGRAMRVGSHHTVQEARRQLGWDRDA